MNSDCITLPEINPEDIPKLTPREPPAFYDTHAHFDDEAFDEDRDTLLPEIHRQGIALINNIGCDVPSSRISVQLAETYPFVYAAVGIWPGNTGSITEDDIAACRELAAHKKVVAIGEIGLDYHYDDVPRDVQKYWFRRQLALAEEVNRPVVVHEREAHGVGMEIVREWADRVPGVFHCFSGSAEMAKELVRLGWYVSFTGVVNFKNARKAVEAVKAVPMDRIMIETDSPYMAPVPYRGKRCHSGYVPKVAEKIAEIKGLETSEVAKITMENGKRFFRIPDEVSL